MNNTVILDSTNQLVAPINWQQLRQQKQMVETNAATIHQW